MLFIILMRFTVLFSATTAAPTPAPTTKMAPTFCCENDASKCIPIAFMCDDYVDCPDESDEKNCAGCRSYEFACSNTRCIHERMVCDGVDSCGDGGSDEIGCPLCQHDEFQCDNNSCVHIENVCDGEDNCGDGSDEMDCPEAGIGQP